MFYPLQQIGPYTLMRLLGRGGFGEVWLAERRGALMTTQVAVKLPLDPSPDLEAIRHEAETWLRASGHPNVLPVIEADIYNGQVAIVSEYAPGGSLEGWLKQHGGKAPSNEAAIAMASGILAGLEHLHHLSTPIVHRDLKPDNVLLQGDQPRLTDFGISRVLKTTAQTQHASGTPHYMPPEAFAGRYSPQSDVWAVGVMLYQMLSGTLPFPQTDIPSLYGAILTGTPPPLPAEVPPVLKATVLKALTKDPAQRFPSAAAMQADLKRPETPLVIPPVPDPVIKLDPDKNLVKQSQRDEEFVGMCAGIGAFLIFGWRAINIYNVDGPQMGLLLAFVKGLTSLLACGFLGGMLGGFLGTGINFLKNSLKSQ